MENAILKEMYVRTLTEEEFEAVEDRNVKAIKEITGTQKNFMLGDSVVAFADRPIEKGLYKFQWKPDRAVYYIVQKVLAEDRAFCYSIY
ncbi:MAG: hypothetical protein PHR62_02665 [Paludibacter sp.]|nr:hypothetical protein [Paludibacter sp.]